MKMKVMTEEYEYPRTLVGGEAVKPVLRPLDFEWGPLVKRDPAVIKVGARINAHDYEQVHYHVGIGNHIHIVRKDTGDPVSTTAAEVLPAGSAAERLALFTEVDELAGLLRRFADELGYREHSIEELLEHERAWRALEGEE